MEKQGKRTYICAVPGCGKRARNNKVVLSRSEPILDEQGNPEYDVKGKPMVRTITGEGLGTWKCPVHGKTKVEVKNGKFEAE